MGPSATGKSLDQLPHPQHALGLRAQGLVPLQGSQVGPCILPQTERPGQGWGLVSVPLSLRRSLLDLPVCYPRIGRKITVLLQLLLFGILGLSTAFVPSFELYMALRFAVATAVAGYTFSNITLREYMSPEAVRLWGLGGHIPTLPVGPVSNLYLTWWH